MESEIISSLIGLFYLMAFFLHLNFVVYLVPYFLEPWATSATQWLSSSFMQEGTTAFPQIELVVNGSFTDTSAWTVPEVTQNITEGK